METEKKENHIKNIIKIINYIAEEIHNLNEKEIFNKVYENLHKIMGKKALYCEISNLISFWEMKQKNISLEECLKEFFKNRNPIYELLIKSEIESLIKKNKEENLKIIIEEKKKMDFNTLKEYCFISVFLNWLQGPLRNKISNKLKDFIGYTATLINYFHQDSLSFEYIEKIDKENFIEEKDFELLKESKLEFLVTLYDCLHKLKNEIKNNYNSIIDEFLFVHKYLKKLETEIGDDIKKLFENFSYKIIISISLIYLTNYPITIKIKEIDKFDRIIKNFITRYSKYSDKEISKI